MKQEHSYELERLVDAIGDVVLIENLVILGDTNAVQNSSDVLEAVDPLLTLRALATDVNKPKRDNENGESGKKRKEKRTRICGPCAGTRSR